MGPTTGACIGYCANRLAVKMIFWPHTEWRVLGVRVPFTPGMFVARRQAFAEAFAQTLVDRFCGPKDVIRGLGQALDAGLEERVRARMPAVIFSIIAGKLASLSADDVKALAEGASTFIRESNVVTQLVTSNVEAMSPVEIEALVREICGRELRSMAFFDAGIGFLVGLLQALVAAALSS